jgi:hypothetical protein
MRKAQLDLKNNVRELKPGEMVSPEEKKLKLLPEEAQEQIRTSGEITPQLNEKILTADPSFTEALVVDSGTNLTQHAIPRTRP